ncbi:MAG: ABC transporter permease [Bacteroidales bacterium]|nr:ABC transporter permease [Bacteroidales bacterium]
MLFKKRTYETSGSLSAMAWRKLRRNKLSMSALFFIGLAIIVAVLGYLITPDSSPFANRQHLELATIKPGTTVKMLRVRRNEEKPDKGFLHRMIHGKKSVFKQIPFNNYRFKQDKIIMEQFSKTEVKEPFYQEFSLADVVFPLSTTNPDISTGNGKISFNGISGKRKTYSIDDLRKRIKSENIIEQTYLLGTDRFGRDMLSRLLIGTRVSLSVGFISVFISLLIGITLGSLGGFFRGRTDSFIVWLINVVWSMPTLLLVIAITFALGKGFWQIFVAVGLTMWVEVARVVRGQILSIREKEFVEAGRALGYGSFRLITRHILPNVLGVVIVISAANFASAILIEAGLSFLGIGVQPPMPSWGTMIKENYAYIILDAAHLAILPGIAIMLMVLAFMLVGNGLRDALDVKTVETASE